MYIFFEASRKGHRMNPDIVKSFGDHSKKGRCKYSNWCPFCISVTFHWPIANRIPSFDLMSTSLFLSLYQEKSAKFCVLQNDHKSSVGASMNILQKRNNHSRGWCYLCKYVGDSIIHLFLECLFIKEVWNEC
jgi:hypothetical protein